MGRRAAIGLHAALSVLGLALYVVFVIPRWWVLIGDIPTTAATAGRIAAGVPIALAAVPVALVLQRSIVQESKVPEIALRLRAWSGVLHVVAGVLIVLAAVAEIWLGLGAAGPWLFAVYGAAGAMAVLGITAFYLSFVADKPPAEPKPAEVEAETETAAEAQPEVEQAAEKPKTKRRFRRRTSANEPTPEASVEADVEETQVDETVTEAAEDSVPDETPDEAGTLRNKRPTGKSRRTR